MFPKFNERNIFLEARVTDIKMFYEMELGKPLLIAYKLSDKVLAPSNIEKTNVILADSLFHVATINGLQFYAKKGCPTFQQTTQLLSLFRPGFHKMNVNIFSEGQRTLDSNSEAVSKDNKSDVLNYLNTSHEWLDLWEKDGTNGLSKQTFTVAKQTTSSFRGLINYLLDEWLSYVILRYFQSDHIENRFGWFWQLERGNYFNSVLQFFFGKTIRIRLLIEMGSTTSDIKQIFSTAITENESDATFESDHIVHTVSDVHFDHHLEETNKDNSILPYVSGSIARSLLRKFPQNRKHVAVL